MRAERLTQAGALQLIQIEANKRSHRAVKDLSVETNETEGTVVLKGTTRTYHSKQLAQHGVFDLLTRQDVICALNLGETAKLDNQIQVK